MKKTEINISNCRKEDKKKPKTNTINKLLKRPEFAEEMKDKALDVLEEQIKLNQRKHDEEIASLDLEIEEEVRNREELTKMQGSNAILRTRLQEELTFQGEPALSSRSSGWTGCFIPPPELP